MRRLPILSTLTISLICLGFGVPNYYGVIRHDKSIDKYREMGKRSQFNCVGRYSLYKTKEEYAVGVLVAPQWVLTAAHFVQEASVWKFGDNFYRTKTVIKHPKLPANAEEAQWDGWDMALVELESPVLDIEPAERYRGNKELGKTITKLGYGFVGDGNAGLANSRVQERLGGQNVVDAIGGVFEGREFSTSVMVCDFDNPENPDSNHFGSPIPLELEIGGSKGDSGGGIFMEDNGKTVLVGIVSGALNRKIKYGSVMALARISTANEWIDSVIY